jgi:hypothetical protein
MDERDAPANCPACEEPATRMLTAGRVLAQDGGDAPGGAAGAYPRMRHAAGCFCC